MSKNAPRVSEWKLMLVGSSSVVLKRLFVAGLAMLSLAVWAVTIISVGVLRNGDGGPGSVRSVQAALPQPAPRVEAIPAAMVVPAAEATTPETPLAEVPITAELPKRDPFAPVAAYFPPATPKVKDVVEPKAGSETPVATEDTATVADQKGDDDEAREMKLVESLRIMGTLVRNGRTLVIIDDSLYGEGDTLAGKLVITDISDRTTAAKSNGITRKVIVLRGGVRDYVVEIKQ